MEKGLTKISVAGFKSIANEIELEIRPLTILAGANSSGKSSFMQPLLLLKQTQECDFDPGPLLLNGPNVRFTRFKQFVSTCNGRNNDSKFSVGIYGTDQYCVTTFKSGKRNNIFVDRAEFINKDIVSLCDKKIMLSPSMSDNDKEKLLQLIPRAIKRGFSDAKAQPPCIEANLFGLSLCVPDEHVFVSSFIELFSAIYVMIHIPGLRGNPKREYPVAGTGPWFPGTFENYTASLVAHWDETKSAKLKQLCENLELLGLSSRISAKRVNDAQVEVMVGRLPKNGRNKAEMVSIADVGFGVSQTLPVLVALLAAEPGQLVYLEQPEIHLHPRAQKALAEILVAAADRGVKVVAETHSSMLLLAVQTLIARKKITPDNVAMHWFERNKAGMTKVTTAEIDEAGRFGEWPVDFGDVELETEGDYIKFASLTLRKR